MSARQHHDSFVRELRRALRALYEPAELRKSQLIQVFGVAQQFDPASALRQILSDGLDALRPPDDVSPHAHAWRIHQVLQYRYKELSPQGELARDLGLSIRQVRRHEQLALQALADHLWLQHGLDGALDRVSDLVPARDEAADDDDDDTVGRDDELEWLHASLRRDTAELHAVVGDILNTARPLLDAAGVRVETSMPTTLPPLAVDLTTMRQGLLTLLTMLSRAVPGGRLLLTATQRRWDVLLALRALRGRGQPVLRETGAESVAMARTLIELSGGSVDVTRTSDDGDSLAAQLVLPASEQVTVLVIDDNASTLHLMQRFLTGTRYRFVGVRDPAAALADEHRPQLIVLDVMLPGIDGWEVLGRVRAHPRTSDVPVIVCTILPQEQLALALGAAAFMRKPVSRQALLTALDQQFDRAFQRSG